MSRLLHAAEIENEEGVRFGELERMLTVRQDVSAEEPERAIVVVALNAFTLY
jgi:hypothetical protein